MLGSVRDQSGAGAWSVLVLDAITTKVLSNVCGVSDVMEYGVSRECRVCGAGRAGRCVWGRAGADGEGGRAPC